MAYKGAFECSRCPGHEQPNGETCLSGVVGNHLDKCPLGETKVEEGLWVDTVAEPDECYSPVRQWRGVSRPNRCEMRPSTR
jgi:hypothetical protein